MMNVSFCVLLGILNPILGVIFNRKRASLSILSLVLLFQKFIFPCSPQHEGSGGTRKTEKNNEKSSTSLSNKKCPRTTFVTYLCLSVMCRQF